MFSDFINFWNESIKNKIIVLLYGLFFSSFIIIFLGRSIIRRSIDEKIVQFNLTNQCNVSIKDVHFKNINTIEFQDVLIIPKNNDTLANISFLRININFFKLLLGKIVIKEIFLDTALIMINIYDTSTNYDFLKPKNQISKKTSFSNNYYDNFKKLLNTFFDIIPSKITVNYFSYRYTNKDYKLLIRIPHFSLNNNEFNTLICTKYKIKNSFLKFSGTVNKKNKSFDLLLICANKDTFSLPFLKYRYGVNIKFDSLKMIFESKEREKNHLQIRAQFFAKNSLLFHPKIATTNVFLPNLKLSVVINIAQDYIEMDSLSEVLINGFGFHPYIAYKKGKYQDFVLKIHKENFNANDLFVALPQGLFVNFNGFEANGSLAYHLFFHLNTQYPDSLTLESEIKSTHFRIKKFGKTNFSYFNEAFVYTPYEKGIPVRDILISADNPMYTPLIQISPNIINALLTSEDGAFFYHRGFLLGSFKEAIAANIKSEKFVRGGSTISMQLVKNLFLSKSKTIARKLEEMLIVWLIENNGLSTKERMLEVYLNIIEWGPNVYGIGEAAKFYFNKKPSQINLSEAIYLASIVPRPKKFMYTFDKQGVLRDFVANYYQFVGERMLKYKKITQYDLDNLIPIKEFKGDAKNYILKTDTLLLDSLNNETPFF